MNLEGLEETRDVILKSVKSDILLVKADISKVDEVKEMSKETFNRFNDVFILVNNAGVRGVGKRASSFSLSAKEAEFDRIIDVNLKGAWNMTKIFHKKMKNNSYSPIAGKIINITSCAGTDCGANPLIGIYSVSKAGLIMFTKLWALELGASNITVNAICPGIFFTPIYESREFIKEWMKLRNVKLPIDRIGDTTDVAEVALFLASPAADYITGQNIVLDGGMTSSINKL
ncbi:MAG: SDR family oxidoreductase [Promethearchaeota archaeon]|nr:MAG: SDR family oxidoreductase [Candidatus Lokiarchaeota archaeon]